METSTNVFGPGTTPQSGGSLPLEVRQYYNAKLLATLYPLLKYAKFMTDENLPQHVGTTMLMRRFERVPANTTALTEGVTPSGSTPTMSSASVTIAQYGDWMAFSEFISWTAIDNVVTQIVKQQAKQTAETIDVLGRNVMLGGTAVQYANGRTSRVTVQAGDNLTGIELKKAVLTLKNNFVDPFDDGCYVMIISVHAVPDIEAISEWLAVHEYSDGQSEAIYKGEVGRLWGVRFVESNLATVYAAAGAAGINVYGSICFGQDAFRKSAIDGAASEVIIMAPGSAGTSDPLRQRQTAGWKITFGGTVSQQLAALRLEHATTY